MSATDSACMRASSCGVGGSGFTTRSASIRRSSSWVSAPFAVSTVFTSWPRVRSASAIRSPEASDTSRSEEVPPIRTVIRM